MCSLYDCCISQPLQPLKIGALDDGRSQSRLQNGRQFYKLSTKERRDLQVFVGAAIGNKYVLTDLLAFRCFVSVLLQCIYTDCSIDKCTAEHKNPASPANTVTADMR